MTSIKGPAPLRTPTISSSSPTTASNSAPATGSGVSGSQQTSTFTAAATGSGSGGLQKVLGDAKDALKDVSGSAKDDFLAYLDKPYASAADQKKGLEAFQKLAENGDITEEQAKVLQKAVGWRMAGRMVVQQMLSEMEKIMQDVNKKK